MVRVRRSMEALRGSLDLFVVIAVAVAGMLGLAGGLPVTARIPVGALMILLAPGYALVSLLVPRKAVTGLEGTERSVTLPERLLLALGLSVILVALFGIVLHYYKGVIQPWDTTIVTGSATILFAVLALCRRVLTDPEQQMRTRVRGPLSHISDRLDGDRHRDTTFNLILIALLVVAAAGVGFAVATTENGERYTEFYLLTEANNGTLVADDYPETLTVDEPTSVHVGITNHEGERVTYTVVVQLQRVEQGDGSTSVTERFDLDSFQITVRDGQTINSRHSVRPPVTGKAFRLTYLLFEGSPPPTSSTRTAYRSVHLWVDVAPSGNGSRQAVALNRR